MKELLLRVFQMNKSDRIKRLIELGVKKEMQGLDFTEELEMTFIQGIRLQNGEIDKVLKDREESEKFDNQCQQ